MRKVILATLVWAMVAFGQAPDGKGGATSDRPISKMQWLVGGFWSGQDPGATSGARSIQAVCAWEEGQNAIRLSGTFMTSEGVPGTYTGRFYTDPNSGTLMIGYVTPEVSLEGPVTVNGDSTDLNFGASSADGKDAGMRVVLSKTDGNHFKLSMSERADANQWRQIMTINMSRR